MKINIRDGISIDVRSDKSLYITIGNYTYYIDDSTGEQIMDHWENKKPVEEKQENNKFQEIMSSRDVCKMLNVSIDTLNRYCMDSKITFYKPNGGNRLFFKKDVLNYLKNHRHPSKADIKQEYNDQREISKSFPDEITGLWYTSKTS